MKTQIFLCSFILAVAFGSQPALAVDEVTHEFTIKEPTLSSINLKFESVEETFENVSSAFSEFSEVMEDEGWKVNLNAQPYSFTEEEIRSRRLGNENAWFFGIGFRYEMPISE